MSKKLREAVVERAAQLIEKGWCRGALARDGEGNKVGVYSDDAVACCVVGPLMRATREVAAPVAARGEARWLARPAP